MSEATDSAVEAKKKVRRSPRHRVLALLLALAEAGQTNSTC